MIVFMATITVRNLSDELVSLIKESAKNHGVSMEQEVRDTLTDRFRSKKAVLDLIESSWLNDGKPSGKDLERWVRMSREWNRTS